MTDWYKIEIFLPEEALEVVMDALASVGAGVIGEYERCFSFFPVTGTFLPLKGAHPYSGQVGEVARMQEYKLEVNCREECVAKAVQAVRAAHPYEEPVINVIALNRYE